MGVSVGKQQLVFSQSDSIPGQDPGAEKCSGAPAHSQRSTGTQCKKNCVLDENWQRNQFSKLNIS